MQIGVARVLAGTETPAGDGVTGALRCVLVFPGGERRSAVLKRGPAEQVAAEAFCGLLLRAWGLPVPEPVLVGDGETVSFASIDVGYPNLKKRLSVPDRVEGPVAELLTRIACNVAATFKSTPLAVACDEAIDNRDRNLGNILWDGNEEAWIDHAFAVGVGASMPDVNKLCIMVRGTPKEDEVRRGSVANALIMSKEEPDRAAFAIGEQGVDGAAMAGVVAVRLSALASRVLARLPGPSDLLSDVADAGGAHE